MTLLYDRLYAPGIGAERYHNGSHRRLLTQIDVAPGRQPLSASSRGARAGSALPLPSPPKDEMSAPAEKARPRPDTTTTLRSSWPSSHRAAASISRNVCDDNGFSFSGRAKVRTPRGPSTLTSIVSKSIGGNLDHGDERDCFRAVDE